MARVCPVINSRLNSITRKRKMWHKLKVRIQANEMYKQVDAIHTHRLVRNVVCVRAFVITNTFPHLITPRHTSVELFRHAQHSWISYFDVYICVTLRSLVVA